MQGDAMTLPIGSVVAKDKQTQSPLDSHSKSLYPETSIRSLQGTKISGDLYGAALLQTTPAKSGASLVSDRNDHDHRGRIHIVKSNTDMPEMLPSRLAESLPPPEGILVAEIKIPERVLSIFPWAFTQLVLRIASSYSVICAALIRSTLEILSVCKSTMLTSQEAFLQQTLPLRLNTVICPMNNLCVMYECCQAFSGWLPDNKFDMHSVPHLIRECHPHVPPHSPGSEYFSPMQLGLDNIALLFSMSTTEHTSSALSAAHGLRSRAGIVRSLYT